MGIRSIFVLPVGCGIYWLAREGRTLAEALKIDEMEVGVGDQKIKPNYENLKVADGT